MLKGVYCFVLEKCCRWSHTDLKRKKQTKKKKDELFLSSVYICVIMTFADVFVGSVSSFIHCHTFMTSKYRCLHVAFYHLFFCKVYILITVMILSLAVSSLPVSVCHGRYSVWICFHIMDLCILLKIWWIKNKQIKRGFLFCFPQIKMKECENATWNKVL